MIVLTGRKAEICKLLMSGVHPVDMPKELGMAKTTLKMHLKSIYLRAGIGDEFAKSVRLVYLISKGEVKLS